LPSFRRAGKMCSSVRPKVSAGPGWRVPKGKMRGESSMLCSRKTKGFTLIELLIVVAIIAILAAIAVPNFLEAQTRARVSRVKADIRSLATAIESYYVDHGTYPPDGDDTQFFDFDVMKSLVPGDDADRVYFDTAVRPVQSGAVARSGAVDAVSGRSALHLYLQHMGQLAGDQPLDGGSRSLRTISAFRTTTGSARRDRAGSSIPPWAFPIFYDPTNGTLSTGDIHYFGGMRTPLWP
jgi:prepilin-type N-terminal cleavage/methylation domain-containing protein